MRAAVVTGFDRPLEIKEIPIPEPGPGQIRVQIEASGLCHTDIHAARGDWPVKPKPPFIPGHESIGLVEKLGAGVTEHAIGQRVAIPWLGYACGICKYCVTGREMLCPAQLNTGYTIDGGHAEYAVAAARYAVRVPAGIDPAEAAPLACAGVTTFTAMKAAGVTPGDQVAIFGIGGLGHLALQYAQIFGGNTVAIDVTPEKLELAKQLGATHTVNSTAVNAVTLTDQVGEVDVAVVLAAHRRVLEQAYACLSPGGRLVLVSLPKDNTMSLPIFQTVRKGIHVIGSIGGTRADLAEVFQLHAAGRTQVRYEVRKLDGINEAIADVLSSRVEARLVLVP